MENAEAQTQSTCFMAIELSKASWIIGIVTPLSNKVSLRKVRCGDVQRLMEIVDRTLDHVRQATERPAQIVSCYEAGYDGFWLHRVLEARGIPNHVLDAASLLVTRKARRAKTDRLDAEKLLRTLMAYWRGEPRVCSVARPPSAAEEDAKRLHRERAFLMKERVQHIGRIKGLLATQGIYNFQPSHRDWLGRLGQLITGDGRPLGMRLKAELSRQCRRLAMVNTMLKEIDEERDSEQETPESPPTGNRIRCLVQLKGVGPQIARVLATEVFYRQFSSRRSLGGYLGLTPSPLQSGNMAREQGITKAGNRRARTTAIELAWLWLRYQPRSALACWFQERTSGRKGRIRRIIIVAVARKLVIALWRYLETGLVPSGAELKA